MPLNFYNWTTGLSLPKNTKHRDSLPVSPRYRFAKNFNGRSMAIKQAVYKISLDPEKNGSFGSFRQSIKTITFTGTASRD
jgi:hypothetical protein